MFILSKWYESSVGESSTMAQPAMANNSGAISLLQPSISFIKGVGYDFWSTKMKTLFRSQDLWELVEKRYNEAGTSTKNPKDTIKRDSKPRFFIQQHVNESIFPRTPAATKSREAWDTLRQAYLGSAEVLTIKLQILGRKFETRYMKESETMNDYFSKCQKL